MDFSIAANEFNFLNVENKDIIKFTKITILFEFTSTANPKQFNYSILSKLKTETIAFQECCMEPDPYQNPVDRLNQRIEPSAASI